MSQRRFLITGLPRIRSAWMAALFSGEQVRMFHDAVHHGGIDKLLDKVQQATGIVGLCDPAAACVYPRRAIALFERWPIIMVRRDREASRSGLAQWSGVSDLPNWQTVLDGHDFFLREVGRQMMWVDFDDLDDYDVVSELYRLCTGLQLDKSRFELFNTLKIEQHSGKAAAAWCALRH